MQHIFWKEGVKMRKKLNINVRNILYYTEALKFMFSKKATKIDEIFTVDLKFNSFVDHPKMFFNQTLFTFFQLLKTSFN
jgi:hypothetical protein